MDLTDCLFQWIKTFDLKKNYENCKDLCDGVAITYALVQIAPEFFSAELLDKIEYDCGNNWFLRLSNLRRIYLCIVDYYHEILDRTIPDKLQPNLENIARDYNVHCLRKLLQLILGCAINCLNKEKHIEIMTTLSLQVKQGLKMAIDELESFDDNNSTMTMTNTSNIQQSLKSFQATAANNQQQHQQLLDELNRLKNELSIVNELKENAMQKCQEYEQTIAKLEDDRRNYKMENEKLSRKNFSTNNLLNLSSSNNRQFDSIENENLFQRLNQQLNQTQIELTRMEEQKDDMKIQLELKENEIQKLLLQLDQLQQKLLEFKNDRDELDRLKYLNEEIIKYKNINEIQKKKLEEYSEAKKQMKLLEERNKQLITQIYELEDDKKSISVYKTQLDLCKKQRDELRNKCNEEIFRAEKCEDEIKRLFKKYNELNETNEKLKLELDKYKQENLQLRNAANNNINNINGNNQASNNNNLINMDSIVDMDLSTSPTSSAAAGTMVKTLENDLNIEKNSLLKSPTDSHHSPNTEEKLLRLQLENERLRKELKESNDERVRLLESQLDDEKQIVTKLELKNRLNLQKIIELEGKLRDLLANDDGGSGGNADNIRIKLLKLNELQIENQNLKLMLEKKNDELIEHEERFRKHLNKAKETYGILETHIQNSKLSTQSLPVDNMTLNNSNGSNNHSVECDSGYWRQLLSEKEIENEKLRQEYEQQMAFRDIEERLMSVSFHTMAFNLQRRSAEERVCSNSNNTNNFSSTNSTFLQRQRQVSSRKYMIPSSDLIE